MRVVRFVIIGLLLSGPLSLYEIQQRFASTISLFYSASAGSIQRALRLLVDSGEVTVTDDPDSARGRRVHHVADAGTAAWREWMLGPLTGSDLEQAMLARVFFLGQLQDPAERMHVLTSIRTRAEEELARLNEISTNRPGDDTLTARQRSAFATLDYGQRSTRLALEWVTELAQQTELELRAGAVSAAGPGTAAGSATAESTAGPEAKDSAASRDSADSAAGPENVESRP